MCCCVSLAVCERVSTMSLCVPLCVQYRDACVCVCVILFQPPCRVVGGIVCFPPVYCPGQCVSMCVYESVCMCVRACLCVCLYCRGQFVMKLTV